MKLLCLDIPQPGASLEKYQPHLLNEARHAWQLYKGGIVRDIYFRQDRPGVALIAECESVAAAGRSHSPTGEAAGSGHPCGVRVHSRWRCAAGWAGGHERPGHCPLLGRCRFPPRDHPHAEPG